MFVGTLSMPVSYIASPDPLLSGSPVAPVSSLLSLSFLYDDEPFDAEELICTTVETGLKQHHLPLLIYKGTGFNDTTHLMAQITFHHLGFSSLSFVCVYS